MPVKRELCLLLGKQNSISAASLQVDGTLAFFLAIKMANKESSFEPPADLQRKLLETTTKSIINAVFQHYGMLI